jgi:hypothetical protein
LFGRLFEGKKHSAGKTGEKLPEAHEGLPDSTHPQGLCPRCLKQSSFDLVGSQAVTFDPDSYLAHRGGETERVHIDQVSVFYCRNCRQGIVVVEEQLVGGRSWREPKERGGGVIEWRGIHWWPSAAAHVSADVPGDIAEVFQEAVQALHAECPRASAVMARRTLEAITVEKGVSGNSLAERLKNMASTGALHPTLADWAKEVRLVGNAGAHFDPITKVTKEDAGQLIAFVRELLKYLYELPAELARRRGP